MSWSCSARGAKEDVKTRVEMTLDASIQRYSEYHTLEGDAEAEDCRNAKRAIADALETMTLNPEGGAPNGYEANVYAYGSRSQGSVELHVTVNKLAIESTPPAA